MNLSSKHSSGFASLYFPRQLPECKVDRSAGKFGFCCDDRIRDFARGLPCPARVCYHDSLDSALMKYFGDDNIQKMIAILKVRDDEAITHATIDKALRSAKEKLVKQVATDRRADSQDAWFQYNVMRRS